MKIVCVTALVLIPTNLNLIMVLGLASMLFRVMAFRVMAFMSTVDYTVKLFKSIVNKETDVINIKKLNEGMVAWEFSL